MVHHSALGLSDPVRLELSHLPLFFFFFPMVVEGVTADDDGCFEADETPAPPGDAVMDAEGVFVLLTATAGMAKDGESKAEAADWKSRGVGESPMLSGEYEWKTTSSTPTLSCCGDALALPWTWSLGVAAPL